MPRGKRHIVNSGIYHIMVRGVNKQDIFKDDKDRKTFVRLMYYYKNKLNCKIYAYCLMNNHVHILFQDKNILISDFVRNVTSIYAGEFNKKYDRVGHLFQDRFKSIYVYNEEYLMRLIRYIHRNPEKARISKTENYKWSSYREYITKGKIVEREQILLRFDSKKNIAIKKFKEFVTDKEQEELDKIYISEKLNKEEVVKLIKDVTKLDDISVIKKFDKEKREKIINDLLKIENLKTSQISGALGISKNFKSRMGKKGPDPFFPEKYKNL